VLTMAEPDGDFAAYFAGRVNSVRRLAYALCGDWHTADDLVVLDGTSKSGYRLVNVYVYRGDTITFASASNGVPDAVTPGASEAVSTDDKKAGRKDLPLTVDQLIEVAAAPQLDLFP